MSEDEERYAVFVKGHTYVIEETTTDRDHVLVQVLDISIDLDGCDGGKCIYLLSPNTFTQVETGDLIVVKKTDMKISLWPVWELVKDEDSPQHVQ